MSRPMLQRFVDGFVPDSVRSRPHDARQARVVAVLGWSLVACAPIFAAVYGAFGSPSAGLVVAGGGLCGAIAMLALRVTGNIPLTGHLLTGILALVLVLASTFIGGNASPAMAWIPLVPLLAFAALGKRPAVAWAIVMVAAATAVHGLSALGLVNNELEPEGHAIGHTAAIEGLVVLVLWAALVLDSARAEAIAALERASRQVAEARDEAEAGLRAKAAFMETMSHELRTPLVGVLGNIYGLDDSPLSSPQREAVAAAQRSGERLLDTLDVILDVASFDGDVMKLDVQPFAVQAAVEDAVLRHAEDAHAKGLELVLASARHAERRVRGDERRFRQVVASLVENAVKFTKRGEVAVRVAISDDEGTMGVTVTVSDTGIGISEALLPRVFDPFTQADVSATRRFGGTGLGLALGRRLARAMDGDLTLESAQGKGTTVTFTARFPMASSLVATPAVQRSGRVLVVDASVRARDALAVQLAGLGLEVDVCGTLADAFARLSAARHAAIAVDESFDVAKLVERLRRTPGGPALIVMTHPGRFGTPSSPPDGVDAVLRKPARSASLGRVLDSALARRVAPPAATAEGKLLVLDGHPVLRRVAARFGAYLGYEAVAIASGAEAVAALGGGGGWSAMLVGGRPDGLEEATRAARGHGVAIVGVGVADGADVDVRLALPLTAEALRDAMAGRSASPEDDIDRSALTTLATFDGDGNGDAFTREVVDDFLRQTPESIDRLASAARAALWPEVKRLAHSLKSMSAWVGAQGLSAAAAALEQEAVAGDADRVHESIGEVAERFTRARAGLTRLMVDAT